MEWSYELIKRRIVVLVGDRLLKFMCSNSTFYILKSAYFLLFLLLLSISTEAQSVKINEVVSSNSLFFDENGDTPDWFELYNTTTEPVNITGYTITDNKEDTAKWLFPELVLVSDQYLVIWASDKDRKTIGYPKTLITQGDSLNYLIPTSDISEDWKYTGFDDSGWNVGGSGFGYGDDDDLTELPTGTVSVFVRKEFTIEDIDVIQELILDIDYDDGFVAYINGNEIARANVNGTPPAFNSNANEWREATLYTGGLPDRFVVRDIKDILVNGINTLAIQVHNTNSTSSDLSLIPFLSVKTSTPIDYGIDPPEIIQLRPDYLHTNFKISSGGESLYLFDSTGILIDSLMIPVLQGDISYGNVPASEDYRLFESPTPGEINSGNSYLGMLNDEVWFSHQGGVTSPISLVLDSVEAPSVIRYTMDATEPNDSSLLYNTPITIDSTSVIRAAVFRPGYLPSSVSSRTYIIGNEHALPVVTLVTDPYNFFDIDYGMYASGRNYEPEFPHFGANFWKDWERPLNFTIYELDGQPGTSFNAGVKIFGGWSRGFSQKSLSVFARGRYGISSIEYPIFPDNPYSSYQAIVLRNSGNDWLNSNFRDAALTGLLKGSGLEYQAYRPVVAYLNGEYWGIYNIREKINEHFLASKGKVSPDDIDLLEFNGSVIHGSNEEYLELLDYLNNNDLTTSGNYDYVASRIDINNFIMYQVAQIYYNNRDWPGNNIKFWNHPGGKWRWIVYDTDFGFGIWDRNDYQLNTMAFALDGSHNDWPNPAWSTLMLRKLIDNHGFRNKFINKFADELNTRFTTTSVLTHFDSLVSRIYPEIGSHYERWGSDQSAWADNYNTMRFFAQNRPQRVRAHIMSQFGLPSTHKLSIINSSVSYGTVQVNSVHIAESHWEGYYFEGVPIKVKAQPAPGYKFAYWTGTIESGSSELLLNMSSDLILTPHFEPGETSGVSLVINEINYNSAEDRNAKDWIEIYNPSETTVDLSRWEVKDDNEAHSFVFPNASLIYGEDFIVVTRDKSAFQTFYPDVVNAVGNFNFGLSNSDDAVRLFDPNGGLIDEVYYSSDYPWPSEPNGNGPTLELLDPFFDNNVPESWVALNTYGSPGASNIKITSLEDKFRQDESGIKVFPNPIQDKVNIKLNIHTQTRTRITLHDLTGSELSTIFEGIISPGEFTSTEIVNNLPTGIYLIRVDLDNAAPIIRKTLIINQ